MKSPHWKLTCRTWIILLAFPQASFAVSGHSTEAIIGARAFYSTSGSSCEQSDRIGRENPVIIEGSVALPSHITDATVYLNGWSAKYLQGDHHIGSISVEIDYIRIEEGKLKWNATGVLRDRNFDDGYRFCYYYTVIGWNRTQVNSTVVGQTSTTAHSGAHPLEEVALVATAGSLENRILSKGMNAAVIPRGFKFAWEEGSSQADHHLLQIAYNLDHSEIYGYLPGSSDSQGLYKASWEVQGIFKDNSAKRNFGFTAPVTVLAGKDLSIKEPPFTLIHKEDMGFFGACLGDPSGPQTTVEVVNNVPYDFAVPVLSAWEMGYTCDDEHVQEAGVWLSDIQYEKPSGSPVGKLTYRVSSILRDRDGSPGHYSQHKVSILGLNSNQFNPEPPIPLR
jgi:hypothetical protein